MSDDTDAKPEDETPEGETPEGEAPEGEAPEGEAPEGEDREGEDGGEAGEDEDGDDLPPSLKAKIMAAIGAHKKRIVIAVLGVVLVGGGGAGAYFMGLFHTTKPHEVLVSLPALPLNHEMQRIIVDLKPSPKHARPFIRLTMQAELQGESAVDAYIANEVKIMDALQSHLRGTTVEDLEGTIGSERLRQDFTAIINRVIAPEVAITVLYKEIIIR